MSIHTSNLFKTIQRTVLTGAAGGMMLISACSIQDIGLNVMSGTLSFVEGYTEDLLGAFVPAADELVNFGDSSEE